MGFVPAVKAMVIGHFSMNGQLMKEHFNFSTLKPNLFVDGSEAGTADRNCIPPSILRATSEHCPMRDIRTIVDGTNGFGEYSYNLLS